MANDEALVAKGFPAISEKWRESLREFYRSRKTRLVIRGGRRAGKSSTLCRVAVAEGMYGGHKVPPGDVGIFVFVSVKADEARSRLKTIREILDVLGVSYSPRGMEIELRDRPIIFRVYPANFRTIVGMTCIGFVADECARWRDDDAGANPASEVLSSLRPAMATMRNAKEFLSSSPWAQADAHFEHFERGNTEDQMVVSGASWEFNPTLTREYCQKLEPDVPTFEREYCAIPMSSDSSQFFDAAAIDMCMDSGLVLPNYAKYGEKTTAGADFAFRSDWSSIVIAHKSGDRYRVGEISIQKPRFGLPLAPSEVCASFAEVCRRHSLRGVMADGHYRESIVEHLASHHLAFFDSPSRPADVFVRTRSLMYQGLIDLPKDPDLKSRMLQISCTPTPNGRLSIKIPRRKDSGHSDDISAMVLAFWQKKGRLKEEEVSHLPPEANQATRAKFVQPGWTKEEMAEVRKLERKLRQARNGYLESSYITSD